METKARVEHDLKEAIRSGDVLVKRTLRLALAAIQLAEVENGGPLDEPVVVSILHKEVKSRHETIEDAQRAGRADLEQGARAEIGVLEGYLPRQFTPAELDDLVRTAVAESGASSLREMGQVMKILVPRLEGRATGEQASQAVRKLLQ